jgi:DNA-binding transcriptional MerR regulator
MDEDTKNPSVGIREASKLTGLSHHMITYLGRIGILTPSGRSSPGRGRARRFTFNDVLFLKVIADLLSTGIEVKRLRQALQRARAEAETWIDIRQAPRRFLATDGTEIFVKRKGKLESKSVNRQFTFAFVLDLEPTHRSIALRWESVSRASRIKR